MKTILLALSLLAVSFNAFCQERKPEYDTTTNNIKKFRPDYKDPYAKYTVSIQAGGESGQGLVIGTNLILTSYSLVAGKSDLSYKDASGRTKYFDGYIVADPARGIIILKTEDVYPQFIGLAAATSFNTSLPYYKQQIFYWHKDGNRYIIDTASIPRNEEVKSNYKITGYVPRKVDYSGSKPLQGYIDFDESNLFVGMIVYIDGQPFHINNRPLYELSIYSDLAPKNLADLPSSVPVVNNQKSKPSIYKTDMRGDDNQKNSSASDIITLDYVKRDQQKLSFYFTFKPLKWSNGVKFDPNLRMIDLKSGIVYHPSSSTNIPNFVYNNTSSRSALHFDNIPASVNHVKLFNLPPDIYEYDKELRGMSLSRTRKFFSDVIINNYPIVKKTEYALDEDFSNDGTVAFYCLKSSNMTGDVSISIDGDAVGTLTHYFTDNDITDFCGRSASLTLKLKPGEYKYKAVMGRNKIERKFMITKGKCLGQLIKF